MSKPPEGEASEGFGKDLPRGENIKEVIHLVPSFFVCLSIQEGLDCFEIVIVISHMKSCPLILTKLNKKNRDLLFCQCNVSLCICCFDGISFHFSALLMALHFWMALKWQTMCRQTVVDQTVVVGRTFITHARKTYRWNSDFHVNVGFQKSSDHGSVPNSASHVKGSVTILQSANLALEIFWIELCATNGHRVTDRAAPATGGQLYKSVFTHVLKPWACSVLLNAG